MVSIADLPLVTPALDPAAVAHSSAPTPSTSSQKGDPIPETPSSEKSKKEAGSPEEEELERQIEALAVPGFSIHQEGVFTVITRVQRTGRSRTFPARIARYALC
jgi:hypothetical protein